MCYLSSFMESRDKIVFGFGCSEDANGLFELQYISWHFFFLWARNHF